MNASKNGGSGWCKSLKAVFWSFFGVRRRQDLEADAEQLRPLQLIVAALIGAALFVGILIVVVRLVAK